MNKWLVTATPPTTNGDLHVGHLSGPYLASDVFTRWQRLQGNEVLYFSGGDDNQTYVVTTAERLGTTAKQLAAEFNIKIRETLSMANVSMDVFTTPNSEYTKEIQSFFIDLYSSGKLNRRRQTYPYSEEDGRYLFEAYVQGYCPECYAFTCGAICENCGHPNDSTTLIDSRPTGSGRSPITHREIEVLTLVLEDHRAAIEEFYNRLGAGTRPHLLRFVKQMLERRLPDFPISYPSKWGIPVAIEGFEEQVYNPWAEMYPALGYMARAASRTHGDNDMNPWCTENGYRLVQFLGFDNSFYFSLAHLGLALAHGSSIRPDAILTNEFYHLENKKFSTSRRHLIWASDLIQKYGEDNTRFYLSRRSPENQVANFNESEFCDLVRIDLHQPLERLLGRLGSQEQTVTISQKMHDQFTRFAHRMARAYSLDVFSLRDASETFVNFLKYLADRPVSNIHHEDDALTRLGIAYFCVYASPILPRLSGQLWTRISSGEPLHIVVVENLQALPGNLNPKLEELICPQG